MNRTSRLRRALILMLVLTVGGALARGLWVNGLFSSAETGFFGTCRPAAELAGVMDIEIVGGTAFIAVSSNRGISDQDGIYAMPLSGPLSGNAKPRRLEGAPSDFHPRGLGSFRSPDGKGVFLLAVNRRSSGRFSIETFEVKDPQGTAVLVSQGSVSGGLLNDPQDVAAAGPGAFYVSAAASDRDALLRPLVQRLVSTGILPGSQILYFNGMSFRVAADSVYGARGLVLTPDGNHLLVASMTGRSLLSLSREVFSGNLEEAGSLTLPFAPEKITLDARGEVWAAGHTSLMAWRGYAADINKPSASLAYRVSLSGGVPQEAVRVYGDDGRQIAAASVAASAGKRLLLGSSLDHKLLDCTAN